MGSIDLHGFDELDRDLARLLKEAPDSRRKLHEELGDLMKSKMDTSIASSVNDGRGRVRNWQQKMIGSGGGYAAVRPIGGSSGANSPGAITNYLNSGHKIRRPSGTAKRQRRSRAKVAYVDGRHFYQSTAASIEAPAIALAQKFVDKMQKTLGG